MKLKGRTAIYNYYRDKRNDHWSIIFGLALGWAAESGLEYRTGTAVAVAFAGWFLFRFAIWFTPWSESIRWESPEHINSTPWQPMNALDQVRTAPERAYADRELET